MLITIRHLPYCLIGGLLGSLPQISFADVAPLSNSELAAITSPLAYDQDAQAVAAQASQRLRQSPDVSALMPASAKPGEAPSSQTAPGQAELQVHADYDLSPSSNVTGGSNYGIETTLYSAPIYDNWRIFAGGLYTHEIEPEGEGSIGYDQGKAGFEFHNDALLASFAPTYNHFKGSERIGFISDAAVNLSEDLVLGGGAQLFTRDVPLRALNAGVAANAYDANLSWFVDDSHTLTGDANVQTLSDGNTRSAFSAIYSQHLYDSRRFVIEALANATESQNSKDDNALYYTPTRDLEALGGARVTQPLYQNGHYLYEHSLEITPGVYWQQGFGSSPAFSAVYRQKLHDFGVFDAGIGLAYSRQTYDGAAPQNTETATFDLTEKF